MSSSYTLETAITALKSHDILQITHLAEFFESTVKNSPDSIHSVVDSPEFLQILSEITSEFKSEEMLTLNYRIIQSFFPILPDKKKIEFVDDGFEFCLMEAMNSTNKPFVHATIEFITVIAKQSDYAIDSLFSFGIHSQLLDIAEKKMDASITTCALRALFYLFGENENILSTILQSTLPRIVQLMIASSGEDKRVLLKTITEITNQRCSLCFILFEAEAVPKIYSLLDDPELVTSALPLIGNLCLSSREHVEMLIQMGLTKKLLDLRLTNYASDAYWALSNLTEAAPDLVSNLIVENNHNSEEELNKFVDSILNHANSEKIELKKEAIFFLATLIMFISRNFQNCFINRNVIEALVTVFDVTTDSVVITRVFYVFIRLMSYIEHHMELYDQFMQLIAELKLVEKVQIIEKLDEPILVTKSHELMKQLKELQDIHDRPA